MFKRMFSVYPNDRKTGSSASFWCTSPSGCWKGLSPLSQPCTPAPFFALALSSRGCATAGWVEWTSWFLRRLTQPKSKLFQRVDLSYTSNLTSSDIRDGAWGKGMMAGVMSDYVRPGLPRYHQHKAQLSGHPLLNLETVSYTHLTLPTTILV